MNDLQQRGWLVLVLAVVLAMMPSSSRAKQLDEYGGTPAKRCRNGPSPHFYTEKIGNRWWICDPAGNAFFLKGVYDGVANNNRTQTSFIQAKYAGPLPNWQANWALEQVRRLRLWGFNAVADYSVAELTPVGSDKAWKTDDDAIPAGMRMPFSIIEMMSHDAFRNVDGCGIRSPVKDIMNGVGSVYDNYRHNFGDYFDPNFGVCAANVLARDTWGLQQALKSKYNSYLIYLTIDESDQTGMLDQGPDFSSIDGTAKAGSGPGATEHASWVTLVAAPTQTENRGQGVTYSDTRVYTKRELSRWLTARYSNNVAALNAAWHSRYTTFGSSGGWGRGSGLLDEDGSCPAKGSGNCWIGDPYTLGKSVAFPTPETTAMQSDMSAFYVHYLDQYFRVLTAQFRKAAPGILLQMQLGGWSAPARREVLMEAGKYLDLPILSLIPPWPCADCTDAQARVDFTARHLGDLPWINWAGFPAQLDSAESAYASSNPSYYVTQEARGISYQAMVNAFLKAKDSATGTHHVVGFDWWGMYDMDSQHTNWGLLTPHDNPYDGMSATITGIDGKHGTDQWGYPTGGEVANYGNFIDYVAKANSRIYGSLRK